MGAFIEQFNLRWDLMLAQMVNFLLFFTVFYWLAYKPVIAVILARRQRIEHSLDQARQIDERLKAMQAEMATERQKTREESARLLAEAKQMAESKMQEILTRADHEAAKILEQAHLALSREREQMLSDVRQLVVRSSVTIVEHLLRDHLTASERERMQSAALQSLDALQLPPT